MTLCTKSDYVVRAGAKVIAVRKDWGAAQQSVDKYIRDLAKDGCMYTRTRSQVTKDDDGTHRHATIHCVGQSPGALLVITINRGS